MEHKIYFIEGIPGSGKTTRTMQLLKTFPEQRGICLCEGQKNSLDLARYAILTEEEYERFRQMIADKEREDRLPSGKIMRVIEKQTDYMDHKVYIAFQTLYDSPETNCIADALSRRDVYNGNYDFEQFRIEHLKRWKTFAQSAADTDHIYMCDGVLLQSPLFELIGYYDMPEPSIHKYIAELLDCIKQLNPIIYYNRVPNVQKLTAITCTARKDDPGKWERGFYKWMELTPYCQKANYHGFEGMCAFFTKLQEIELAILDKLDIPYVIYDRIC